MSDSMQPPPVVRAVFESANRKREAARRMLRPVLTSEIPRTDDILGPERSSYRRVVEAARTIRLAPLPDPADSVGFTAQITSPDRKVLLAMHVEIQMVNDEPVDCTIPEGWGIYARTAGVPERFGEEWLAGEAIRQAQMKGVI